MAKPESRPAGQSVVTVVTFISGTAFLGLGIWAFLAPRSFYEVVATFNPFNLHLFHDVGAFQIGIGAALLSALFWNDALFVALTGGTVGAVVHFVSHVMDRDLGGRSTDPWALGVFALLLALALVLRLGARKGVVR
jgi:hypothetical protein